MKRFWDKDRAPPPLPGTSFLPNTRPKTAPSAVAAAAAAAVFPAFRKHSSDGLSSFSSSSLSSSSSAVAPTSVASNVPIISLKLSSPSFLDAVVLDGTSDNPLYVIETEENHTRIRRSDSKGFINVARVLWREHPNYFTARSKKELNGIRLAFGKGQWRPADEFLGYSYSSLSTYLRFYIPHHTHSLRWKRVGSAYQCTTQSVKGPVAILEPYARTPPMLKIFDPVFPADAAQPQRMHAGVPVSLLDFLLVTSMLLLTEHDEWKNITRPSTSSAADPSTPVPAPLDATHEPRDDGDGDDDNDNDDERPASYPTTSDQLSPLPDPSMSPIPRARTSPHPTSRSPSSTSLGSGTSFPARPSSSGIESWRAAVSPSPGPESRSPARRASSTESLDLALPASPRDAREARFSLHSSSSGSHRISTSARELPAPPVPIPVAQSPSPPPSSSTSVWDAHSPAPPLTPASSSYSGTSAPPLPPPISTAVSSTTVRGLPPQTPARALPPVPLPPPLTSSKSSPASPAVRSVYVPPLPLPLPPPPPSQQSYGHGLAPSRSTPHLRRDAQQQQHYHNHNHHHHPSVGADIGVQFKAPAEYAHGVQADADALVDATAQIDISDALPGAAVGIGVGAGVGAGVGVSVVPPRRETVYEAPPPAYSQHDFERSPFRPGRAAAS